MRRFEHAGVFAPPRGSRLVIRGLSFASRGDGGHRLLHTELLREPDSWGGRRLWNLLVDDWHSPDQFSAGDFLDVGHYCRSEDNKILHINLCRHRTWFWARVTRVAAEVPEHQEAPQILSPPRSVPSSTSSQPATSSHAEPQAQEVRPAGRPPANLPTAPARRWEPGPREDRRRREKEDHWWLISLYRRCLYSTLSVRECAAASTVDPEVISVCTSEETVNV